MRVCFRSYRAAHLAYHFYRVSLSEHVVGRAGLTTRIKCTLRRICQDQFHILGETRTGFKLVLVSQGVERSVLDEALFLHPRLQHRYMQSGLLLCSAAFSGTLVGSALLLHLPFHLFFFYVHLFIFVIFAPSLFSGPACSVSSVPISFMLFVSTFLFSRVSSSLCQPF